MATRDLTTAYVRLRSALHRKRPEDGNIGGTGTGLISSAMNSGVDTTALTAQPPMYVEIVNEISADMNAIQTKMVDLEKAHESRLRISFDPDAENHKEREIEIMTAELTRMFNLSSLKIKKLARQVDANPSAADAKVRNNIQRGLATRLHGQSEDFKKLQKGYLGQLDKMRSSGSLNSILPNRGGAAFDRDEGFTDEQMSELANAEEDVDERMREIQRIAKSVEELASMFKELAVLIVEQGTILDRIDHNMEEAVTNTQQGVVNLKKAEEYQKSARPITCMAILMVLIVICVIIIIVKTAG